MPGVKVAKIVVRKTILHNVAGLVVGGSEGLSEGQEGPT